jgi:hypothetical protein
MGTPSLDIVSRLNFAELDNAINNLKKLMAARFDFKGSQWSIEVVQKDKILKLIAEDGTRHRALQEELVKCAMRRGIDSKCFEFGEPESGAAGMLKREVKLKNGLDQEIAKELTKRIKASGVKVQASIQGDEIRLSGKQIDDLRTTMALVQSAADELKVPVQFVNMKS